MCILHFRYIPAIQPTALDCEQLRYIITCTLLQVHLLNPLFLQKMDLLAYLHYKEDQAAHSELEKLAFHLIIWSCRMRFVLLFNLKIYVV